jgi:hypothetical protein
MRKDANLAVQSCARDRHPEFAIAAVPELASAIWPAARSRIFEFVTL